MDVHPTLSRMTKEAVRATMLALADEMEEYVPPAVCIAFDSDESIAAHGIHMDAQRSERMKWASIIRERANDQ